MEPVPELVYRHRTGRRRDRAIVIDEHERRLGVHTQLGPDLAGVIDNVWKGVDTALVDEGIDCIKIVLAGDPEDDDVIAEFLLDGGDRTGLPLARRSPRRPEPQHEIFARVGSELNRGAVRCRCRDVQCSRFGCAGLGLCSGCSLRSLGGVAAAGGGNKGKHQRCSHEFRAKHALRICHNNGGQASGWRCSEVVHGCGQLKDGAKSVERNNMTMFVWDRENVLAEALEPATPGRLVRTLGSVFSGLAATADQITAHSEFWRNEAASALATGESLFVGLGDSLTQGVGCDDPRDSYLYQVAKQGGYEGRILNLSRSGARVNDVLETQIPALETLSSTFDVVVCTVGSNDLMRSTRIFALRRRLDLLLEHLPDCGVIATLPAGGSLSASSVNRHLRAACEVTGVQLADVDREIEGWKGRTSGDAFHPNAAGYEAWTRAFTAALEGRPPTVLA